VHTGCPVTAEVGYGLRVLLLTTGAGRRIGLIGRSLITDRPRVGPRWS